MKSPFMPDWLFAHAAVTAEAPAIATPLSQLNYGELAALVSAFAGHLATAGVERGSHVLVSLPNSPAAVVAGLAVNMLGATSVEASREWSQLALREVADRSRVQQVIIADLVQIQRNIQTWLIRPQIVVAEVKIYIA